MIYRTPTCECSLGNRLVSCYRGRLLIVRQNAGTSNIVPVMCYNICQC